MSAAAIRAVGTALPPFAHRQEDLVSFMLRAHDLDAEAGRRLHNLYRRSRIETRHSCLPDFGRTWQEFTFFPRNPRLEPPPSTARRMTAFREFAPELARRACEDLFRQPGAGDPRRVDHLFVVSCTGFFAPGLDVLLAEALGLRPDVGRTLIGFQGCQGGLTALRLADYLCRAQPGSTALVVCVELCTLHFQNEPTEENLLANALFADGAAAALVSGAEAGGTDSAALRIGRTLTLVKPETQQDMVWTIGDAGFLLRLSSLIPERLAQEVPLQIGAGLGLAGPWGDIACWAVHPGGAAILDGLERSLELGKDRLRASRDILRRFGNMSSPTIFFVLRSILEDPSFAGPGIALAFGPGLTIEAASFEKTAP